MSLRKLLRSFYHALLNLRPRRVTKATVVSVCQPDLLRNKYALITGGTSGIGLAIARAFLESGASVVIAARRKDKLEDSVKELCLCLHSGQSIKAVCLDCSNPQSFSEAIDQAEKEIGCTCFDILKRTIRR